jgi:hypothetical protein
MKTSTLALLAGFLVSAVQAGKFYIDLPVPNPLPVLICTRNNDGSFNCVDTALLDCTADSNGDITCVFP